MKSSIGRPFPRAFRLNLVIDRHGCVACPPRLVYPILTSMLWYDLYRQQRECDFYYSAPHFGPSQGRHDSNPQHGAQEGKNSIWHEYH